MQTKIVSSKITKTDVDWHLGHLRIMLSSDSTHGLNLKTFPVAVCRQFIDVNGNIVPINFSRNTTVINSQTFSEVASLFPNLTKKNTGILTVGDKLTTIPSGKRYAVLFSGGPAPGGHNVVNGIKKALGPNNTLFGVLKGPGGLIKGNLFELSDQLIESFLNKGGFNLLQTDRTKIKTDEQFQRVLDVINKNALDGIIIIGGDDSNTNAAILAEKAILWKQSGLLKKSCQIIGVPKTIDGDLRFGPILPGSSSVLPISFGFHTATMIYTLKVAGIQSDANSTDQMYHFVKLMGRSASHITLEVALKTHPAVTLIGEEIQAKNMSLSDIGLMIARTIVLRSKERLNHGVVLLPEGLIEFIPEIKSLIESISKILLANSIKVNLLPEEQQIQFVKDRLNPNQLKLINSFPPQVVSSLFNEKDPHGNLQVSTIPTETLIISTTKQALEMIKTNPSKYFGTAEGQLNISAEEQDEFIKNFKFVSREAFGGYEGRCADPSNFDSSYTYNLGLTTGSLLLNGYTGYMATISNLASGGDPIGLPLTELIHMEIRNSKPVPVIEKALINTETSEAFKYFASKRDEWSIIDPCMSPSPLIGDKATENRLPRSVQLDEKIGDPEHAHDYDLGTPRRIQLSTDLD